MKLRALVVDDTLLFRSVVADALRTIPDVEVAATVSSGRAALEKIALLQPDLVTLDIEMPGMNGLQVLDEMRKNRWDAGVIIVSSQTVRGGACTIQALEKGAFDFITKPSLASTDENRKAIIEALTPRVKAFGRKREISSILRGPQTAPIPTEAQKPHVAPRADADLSAVARRMERLSGHQRPELILIGVSTGGPAALATLLPAIPKSIGLPILIVQHMPPMFTQALAESLGQKCQLQVKEAADNDRLEPGMVYIAPGGRQMKLGPSSEGYATIQITDDPPENNCKPAVDYLFRSVAHGFPGKSLAVILTGMGSDGTLGLRLLKRQGCLTIAQNEESCVVYGMPKSAVEAGVVDEVLPLDRIAGRITEATRRIL
jgi:two-component system chemotaxis response regulator CheB